MSTKQSWIHFHKLGFYEEDGVSCKYDYLNNVFHILNNISYVLNKCDDVCEVIC